MTYSPFRILLVVLLIAVNGFFAGAEVALAFGAPFAAAADGGGGPGRGAGRAESAVQSRTPAFGDAGGRHAGQPGLGWAGEDTAVPHSARGLSIPLTTRSPRSILHGASLVISFLAISYFHVVMGEVVPKNLAIAKADRLAALVAPACWCFTGCPSPFVVVIERSAGAITRALQLEVRGPGRRRHSAEELKLIVSSSRGLGYLPEAQEDMIHRVLDLGDISVREVMVPRNDIVSIDADATLDEVLRTMIRGTALAPAGVRGRAARRSSAFCTTRTCCRFGRSGAAPSAPGGPAAPFAWPGCCARTWWCPKPSRSRKCSKSSARAARTWPWWWMSSEPSSAC